MQSLDHRSAGRAWAEVTLSFDMDAREVQVDGLDPAAVIDALDEIGFPATAEIKTPERAGVVCGPGFRVKYRL